MSSVVYKYSIEHLEGREWIPKCAQNLEEVEKFQSIASNIDYRIVEDGVDVTNRYRTKTTTKPTSPIKSVESVNVNNSVENVNKLMKPSEYKALSDNDKASIHANLRDLQSSGTKRNDIMAALNVSEATYDVIRVDLAPVSANMSSVTSENKSNNYNKLAESWD